MSASDIPVSILSGGLGAGKTTTLNHLLETAPEERDIAVLVNDMGEVNVDAALVERQVTLDDDETTVTELSNGCIIVPEAPHLAGLATRHLHGSETG
jgi:G3E family GTPase